MIMYVVVDVEITFIFRRYCIKAGSNRRFQVLNFTLGSRLESWGFIVEELGLGVEGLGLRVQGSGFRVRG